MRTEAQAVVFTGTIAAGKTTLAEAVSEELHERGLRHALIDLDWLGQVYPTPDRHDPFGYVLALENLEAVWPNFLATGIGKAIIAGTLLNEDQRDRLHVCIGRIPLAVVLVKGTQEVVEDRIRNRNSGALRDDFLARSDAVAREIEAARIHDFTVHNDATPPRDLAEEVLRKLGWISAR